MTRPILFCFLLFVPHLLQAQKGKDQKQGRFEVGINATSVISKFVGSETAVQASDPPVIFRIVLNKFNIRLGLDAAYLSDEFFDPITGVLRESKTFGGLAKLGIEKSIDIQERLEFYYGLDFYGLLDQDVVTTFAFPLVILQKDVLRLGAGPFVGISFQINERIRLTTESNLLGFYQNTVTSQDLGSGPEEISSTNTFGGEIEPPLSLYLNMRF